MFYDGCPSINPVLKKHLTNNIDGDISLLFYSPCDEHCSEKASKENEKFDGKKSPLGNTLSVKVSPNSMSSDFEYGGGL